MRILLLLAAFTSVLSARPKLDTVVMKNGDRLTCEIKRLERGVLFVKMTYSIGEVRLNWNEIQSIKSPQRFQLEEDDGELLEGTLSLEQSDIEGEPPVIEVAEGEVAIRADHGDVVEVRQFEKGALGRMDASIAYGFAFTKEQNQTQSTLDGSLAYSTTKNYYSGKVSSLFSFRKDAASTNRHNGTLLWERILQRNWFSLALADFLKSDQQQLDLRSTLGGGVGRHIIRSNRNSLRAVFGFVLNDELFSGTTSSEPDLLPEGDSLRRQNAEALVGASYSMYRFDSTEITLTTLGFPSLTTPGRVRVSFDAGLKWDLIGDLYWNVSYFHNFDSRPPADTPKHDLGLTNQIGWSF